MDPYAVAVMALNGAASAVAYSVIFYAKKRERGQEFDPYKFLSTLLVGLAVGASLSLTGIEVNQENVTGLIATNIGIIAVVESAIKWAVRKVNNGL